MAACPDACVVVGAGRFAAEAVSLGNSRLTGTARGQRLPTWEWAATAALARSALDFDWHFACWTWKDHSPGLLGPR